MRNFQSKFTREVKSYDEGKRENGTKPPPKELFINRNKFQHRQVEEEDFLSNLMRTSTSNQVKLYSIITCLIMITVIPITHSNGIENLCWKRRKKHLNTLQSNWEPGMVELQLLS